MSHKYPVLIATTLFFVASPVQAQQVQWQKLVAAAIEASSAQNAGNPRFSRSCQPELRLCNTTVTFRNQAGMDVMVRTATDMNDQPLKDDVCTFNQMGDIRTCYDWNTRVTTKEMENAHGQWYEVGR